MPDFSTLNGILSSALVATLGGIVGALVTLVVNVRIGKNQEDRVELRQIFTAIRQNFIRMQDALKEGHPLTRRSYGARVHGVEFTFLTDDSSETVNEKFLIIPHQLLVDLQDVEKRVLDFGDELYRQGRQVWQAAVAKLESIQTQRIQKPNNGMWVTVGNERDGKRRWLAEFPLMGGIVDENFYPKAVVALQKEGGVVLHMSMHDYHVELYPDALNDMTHLEFLDFVRETMHTLPAAHTLKNERISLGVELQAAIQKLEQRIYDPHPLWETVGTAIKDIFRQR